MPNGLSRVPATAPCITVITCGDGPSGREYELVTNVTSRCVGSGDGRGALVAGSGAAVRRRCLRSHSDRRHEPRCLTAWRRYGTTCRRDVSDFRLSGYVMCARLGPTSRQVWRPSHIEITRSERNSASIASPRESWAFRAADGLSQQKTIPKRVISVSSSPLLTGPSGLLGKAATLTC